MIHIDPIPAFNDNYIWCLYDETGAAVVVDPGDAAPVEAFLASHSLHLTGIVLTHHHFDHVGGVAALTENRRIDVQGPAEATPEVTRAIVDGDHLTVLGLDFEVIAVPGHTLDHLALYAARHTPPLLFCGDTLFAGGCGRLFEGTPEQMHQSLTRLKALPPDTRVYCAHEYTLANLSFAAAVEPQNAALRERLERVKAQRDLELPTVPSSLAEECATNPFLRSDVDDVRDAASGYANISLTDEVDTFAAVRRWKDHF